MKKGKAFAQEIVAAKAAAKRWVFTPKRKDLQKKEKGKVQMFTRTSTRTGEVYKIEVFSPTELRCSCLGWRFHRHCKHCASVQEELHYRVTY